MAGLEKVAKKLDGFLGTEGFTLSGPAFPRAVLLCDKCLIVGATVADLVRIILHFALQWCEVQGNGKCDEAICPSTTAAQERHLIRFGSARQAVQDRLPSVLARLQARPRNHPV